MSIENTNQHWQKTAWAGSVCDQQPQRNRTERSSSCEVDVRELLKTLSVRQKQVATLIFNEYSNKQIARELGLSSKTVEAHRKEAIRRLGCNSTIGLIKLIFPILVSKKVE